MLKLVMWVKRLPHLSRAEFDTHWKEIHGPLVRRHSAVLGIRRYVQTVPLDNPAAQAAIQSGRGTVPVDFDGGAELWWDNFDAHRAARETPDGARALRDLMEDEARFVDLSRSQLWYATERAIIS
ncbi:EthD domain-containing protein [Acidimangrovimonas pyrenivorans]|uniref:EthD domain-containing protein n=1 Tax=Acidimangrovimonas pyrenivorans TaxID=2030798 RepID=A0ABV7ADE9_9RHOB